MNHQELISSLQDEKAQLIAKVDEITTTNRQYKATIEQRDSQIQRLRDINDKRDAEIMELKNQIKTLVEQNASLVDEKKIAVSISEINRTLGDISQAIFDQRNKEMIIQEKEYLRGQVDAYSGILSRREWDKRVQEKYQNVGE